MSLPEVGFRIIGHRGSPRRETENTIASVRAAIAAGADGVEVDARLLADGNAVLFHDDESMARTVEALTIEELRAAVPRVPLISDLGELASFEFVIEVKRHGWEALLHQIVSQFPRLPLVSSFDHRVPLTLYRIGYEGRLGLVFHGYPCDVVRECRESGATVAFPGWRYVDAAMVERCRQEGIEVVPWTVNSPDGWRAMLELGCRGVITDTPDLACQWRAAASQC